MAAEVELGLALPGSRRTSLTRVSDAKLVVVQPGQRVSEMERGGRDSPSAASSLGRDGLGGGKRSPAASASSVPSPKTSKHQRQRRRRRQKPISESSEEDVDDGLSDIEGHSGEYAGIDEASSARLEEADVASGRGAVAYASQLQTQDGVQYSDDEIAQGESRRITWSDEHGMPLVEVRVRVEYIPRHIS